jgi:hypothetical protein
LLLCFIFRRVANAAHAWRRGDRSKPPFDLLCPALRTTILIVSSGRPLYISGAAQWALFVERMGAIPL